jgi:hypothetical protein
MNIEKVFEFIKEKRGYDYPVLYKLLNELPLSDEDLIIDGDLDLNNTKITSLPDNLHVGGFLDLSDTNITSLPDNLHVEGNLSLSHTKITSLPNNLHVGGHLYVFNTKITSLPDNLHVKGNLYLLKTPLSKKYTKEQIKILIIQKGGTIGRNIFL